jgi:crotonobetainyl-CoA:carnitine CoA-transferase CaiB-like acyl-CoA transferase
VQRPDLADHPDFKVNPQRIVNRKALAAELEPALAAMSTEQVISGLEAARVPVGPVQTLPAVFETDQAQARGMALDMEAGGLTLPLIGNPLKLSATPVTYRFAPPRFGADNETLLRDDPFEE